jgi:tetratricopeptide (TPR) repeat protein
VVVSLYNGGLANEAVHNYARAALYYEKLIRAFPQGKDAIDAVFRLGAVYAELKRWPDSAQVFGLLAMRPEISVGDRLEALARQGLAQFQQGDFAATKSTLRKALRFHRSVAASERLETDFFLAMIHYYLAALPHREYREAPMTPGAKLALQLDNKARLLISAQSAYIRTIKVKNGYWAAAAGFQIGSLYREFYHLLMTTLPNFDKAARKNAKKAKISVERAQADLKRVYLEEVHKKVKVLLQKAIRVYEKNLLMAQRVGVQSNWVTKTRMEIDELRHLLTASPADAVSALPKKTGYPEDGTDSGKPEKPQDKKTDKASDSVAPLTPPEPDVDAPGRIVL